MPEKKKKQKQKDPLEEIMDLLEEYDKGTPPKKMESCCKHGDHKK